MFCNGDTNIETLMGHECQGLSNLIWIKRDRSGFKQHIIDPLVSSGTLRECSTSGWYQIASGHFRVTRERSWRLRTSKREQPYGTIHSTATLRYWAHSLIMTRWFVDPDLMKDHFAPWMMRLKPISVWQQHEQFSKRWLRVHHWWVHQFTRTTWLEITHHLRCWRSARKWWLCDCLTSALSGTATSEAFVRIDEVSLYAWWDQKALCWVIDLFVQASHQSVIALARVIP